MRMRYKVVAHNPNSTGGYKSSINRSDRDILWLSASGEDEQDCMAELQKILAGLALVTKMEYIVEDREVLNG